MSAGSHDFFFIKLNTFILFCQKFLVDPEQEPSDKEDWIYAKRSCTPTAKRLIEQFSDILEICMEPLRVLKYISSADMSDGDEISAIEKCFADIKDILYVKKSSSPSPKQIIFEKVAPAMTFKKSDTKQKTTFEQEKIMQELEEKQADRNKKAPEKTKPKTSVYRTENPASTLQAWHIFEGDKMRFFRSRDKAREYLRAKVKCKKEHE